MKITTNFWILLALFQLAFGYVVFALTRDHYTQQPTVVSAHPSVINAPGNAWPNNVSSMQLERLTAAPAAVPDTNDPLQLSRQADLYFAGKEFEQAATLYRRLLELTPNDAEVYNNLGLTLHYLGRSDEALRALEQGVAADPAHQRIRLTQGFVNSQLGNVQQARDALAKAIELGSDESIRDSARQMLQSLQ
ncbi:MAG: tetratricopeptide repeat protein [Woeseiaceae bacterium]